MRLVLVVLFAFLFTTSSAQKITGKIIENQQQSPLAFAEVIVKPITSGELTGTVANENGNFSINISLGEYILEIFYVGNKLYTKKISVKTSNLDLGTISVKNSQQLDEVILTARKKLIERKIDRLVFNVANSSKASQGDVIEVLKITPSIRIENDEITMIGKGSMRVMINEQMLQLTGMDLINYLQSIDSESIKSVEVISNPPARYEAEGNSGLINIVLKKSKNDSWNAQLKGTFIQRTKPNYRTSAYFNYNKDKLTFSGRLGFIKHQIMLQEDLNTRYREETSAIKTPVDIDLEGQVASAEISYEINQNWQIGGQYFFNTTRADILTRPETRISRENNEDVTIITNGQEPQHPRLHKVNLNSQINLDTLGKKVIINLDYLNNHNEDTKFYNGEQIEGLDEENERRYFFSYNNNVNDFDIYSAKIDIENPLKWINLDFGAKYNFSDISSDISSFSPGFILRPIEDPTTLMDTYPLPFQYKENIAAAYISGTRNFGERWSAQLGFRLERTEIDAHSILPNVNRYDLYTNLFPSLYINYNLDHQTNFSASYSRRIQRPDFYELNPYEYYRSPNLFYSGNPNLEPAFIDNVELNIIHKNLVTRLYFTKEVDAYAEIPVPDRDENFSVFSYENYIDRQAFGVSESYTWNTLNWWSSVNNLDISYSKASFNLTAPEPDRNGFNSRLSTNNDFNLNAEKTIIAGLNYWYQFAGFDGIFETEAQSATGVSLQFLLLDKNLNISLRGEDLFRNAIDRRSAVINGVTQEIRNFYDTRQFWLSVSYKFGNNNLKVKSQRSGNSDIERRAGG